jgi:hypothetical protein
LRPEAASVCSGHQGAPPGNIGPISPAGIVDAGEAGIRASGNLDIGSGAVVEFAAHAKARRKSLLARGPSQNGSRRSIPSGAHLNRVIEGERK